MLVNPRLTWGQVRNRLRFCAINNTQQNSFIKPVPTVSCFFFYLTRSKSDIVFCCCSFFTSRFEVLCILSCISAHHSCVKFMWPSIWLKPLVINSGSCPYAWFYVLRCTSWLVDWIIARLCRCPCVTVKIAVHTSPFWPDCIGLILKQDRFCAYERN